MQAQARDSCESFAGFFVTDWRQLTIRFIAPLRSSLATMREVML